MDTDDDSRNWHDGCEKCEARNAFVIPEIIAEFQRYNVEASAFVGSATAYIPHKVTSEYPLRACVLIDPHIRRMNFSNSVHIEAKTVERIVEEFESAILPQALDALVVSNTLLEFELQEAFVASCWKSLRNGGRLLIFLPDVLEDVVGAYIRGDHDALKNFSEGCHQLTKKDKFTEKDYNFFAQRNVTILAKFLDLGFVLRKLKLSKTTPKYVMMLLERTDAH
ncbi:hypothetical protein [Hyphomonas sp. UBA4494]|jgi:hypothetical protein|uniref:hypothetical protein n=1 Tax=Hyphomonas sp. UBA4494 TaxID=1946631 RepID=UPI0025C3C346|nr:hypothetical protein [Hyphomonas sp. UBA4494]